ncbi:MAG: Asp-tRNA(Asn)/Glu-tRNA(Gln) amidotransferase subunit GatC [Candidatus Babeliales bacterium]
MTKISKEELLKIAQISQLRLDEHEIAPLAKQIQDLLTYAERVREVVAGDIEQPSNQNVNVLREDVVAKTNPEPILERAPEREQDYFVVPKIIENK